MLTVLAAGVTDCNPSSDGLQYMGTKAVTENGRTCQAWTSQSPHAHTFDQDYMFPDGTAAAAENYCRNPISYEDRLWCYTTDPAVRWEECDVISCGQLPHYVT